MQEGEQDFLKMRWCDRSVIAPSNTLQIFVSYIYLYRIYASRRNGSWITDRPGGRSLRVERGWLRSPVYKSGIAFSPTATRSPLPEGAKAGRGWLRWRLWVKTPFGRTSSVVFHATFSSRRRQRRLRWRLWVKTPFGRTSSTAGRSPSRREPRQDAVGCACPFINWGSHSPPPLRGAPSRREPRR